MKLLENHELPVVATGSEIDLVNGLAPADAASRLRRSGLNRLPEPRPDPTIVRLLTKLLEPMSLLLISAAGIAWVFLGELLDAVVILAVVAANAVIALAQEGKASRALEALKDLETKHARVVRGGRAIEILAEELVVGDIVLLTSGDRVPGDLRLFDTSSMEIDESLLTGESLAVPKDASDASDTEASLGDRRTIAFSGTIVTRGAGRGIVVATGAGTELGAIATQLEERQPSTPLQRELRDLTGVLGIAAMATATAVFLLSMIITGVSEGDVQRSLLVAVALAVAAVPEGLASVVTVALALGVRRMAEAGAIVRRLPAVETLGSTDVILTDKTGTLTQNRMRAEMALLPGRGAVPILGLHPAEARQLLEVAALCNDASIEPPAGDPLEIALLEAAGVGLVEQLKLDMPRLDEAPFDSERKLMSTLHRSKVGLKQLVKGAPEAILARCATVAFSDGVITALEEGAASRLEDQVSAIADGGMRVLAFAGRVLDEAPEDLRSTEWDLTLMGFIGLRDPLRPQASDAVREAQEAGIRLIMVTGDHPNTAATIAGEVGILRDGDGVLAGSDLRTSGVPEDPTLNTVYARVDPEDKLMLVRALHDSGHVVAVTGDGVNDVLALRSADIGVAMGRGGTDAAREASDMVITDDDLSTVVRAIREGRGIYANIRKVVDYLVAANLSEILVVVSCLLFFPGLGVPLLPIQLLWINLLTDGLPALALGVDPADPGIMRRSPRPRTDRLLSRARLPRLGVRGLMLAGAALSALVIVRYRWEGSWGQARVVMFTVLAVSQLFYSVAIGDRRNRWLWGAVGTGLVLQIVVVLASPLHRVFGTSELDPGEWVLIAFASVVPAVAIKLLDRSHRHRWKVFAAAVVVVAVFVAHGRPPDELPYVAPQIDPLPNQTVSLMVVGDYGIGGDDEESVAKAMHAWVNEHGATAFVTTGDNVYPEAEPEYFDAAWTRPFGWVNEAEIPVLPSLGNHDVEDGSSAEVMDFFDMPGAWFSEQVRNVAVVVLDSNQVSDPAQTAWLDETLKAIDADWTIVVVHKPPYDCGRYDGTPEVRSAWSPLFERYGVDLVLSGHDHNYQRFAPLEGVTYVVTGGGGDAFYPLKQECAAGTPARLAGNDNLHHFLAIRGSRTRLSVLAIGYEGSVIDRFEIHKS